MIGEQKTLAGVRSPPPRLEGGKPAPVGLAGERRVPVVLNGNSDGAN